jgi:hypothetical protein
MAFRHSYKPDKSQFISEEDINQVLSAMESDILLNTSPVLVNDSESSVRLVTFSEKHAAYLKSHPSVNPQDYLANLKTMVRKRIKS